MALTTEQLEARKSGIGASEIAAVMGLDPFKTPLDVYLDKRGLLPEREETEPMYWGTAIEPVIRHRYHNELLKRGEVGGHTERFLLDVNCPLVRHPEHPFVICTPDVAILHAQREGKPLLEWGCEIKNKSAYVSHEWGESGSTDVPFYVQLQAQWSMLATGVTRWDVAVLIGGNDFRLYTLTANPEAQADLLSVAEGFWKNVTLGIEPLARAEDNEKMAKLKRQRDESLMHSNELLDEYATALAHAREQIRMHEATKNEMEALIKQFIGDGAGVVGPYWKATWRTAKPSKVVDWKALALDVLTAKYSQAEALELEKAYTTEKPGTRRFLFTPPLQKSEE